MILIGDAQILTLFTSLKGYKQFSTNFLTSLFTSPLPGALIDIGVVWRPAYREPEKLWNVYPFFFEKKGSILNCLKDPDTMYDMFLKSLPEDVIVMIAKVMAVFFK